MQISALDYDSYVGVIGVGRITRGKAKPGMDVQVVDVDGNVRKARILEVKGFHGLQKEVVAEAEAGDIVCISGIDKPQHLRHRVRLRPR